MFLSQSAPSSCSCCCSTDFIVSGSAAVGPKPELNYSDSPIDAAVSSRLQGQTREAAIRLASDSRLEFCQFRSIFPSGPAYELKLVGFDANCPSLVKLMSFCKHGETKMWCFYPLGFFATGGKKTAATKTLGYSVER